MRAVIYTRVSTAEQTKGYSLGNQAKRCEEYARREGLTIVETIKEDVSGAAGLEERAHGRRLLELAQLGQIDAVVVWRLDRLSRPPEGEYSRLLTTIEMFARHGVTVHECEMGAVKNEFGSIMMVFFKGLAASDERKKITERSREGLKAKAADKGWIGQGRGAPYGYRKVGRGRDAYLEINEDSAKTIRGIFRMYIGGKTIKAIAVQLSHEGIPSPGQKKGGGRAGNGGWHPSTISRGILQNRAYIGVFEAMGREVERPELAILDKATWKAAQARKARNVKRARRNRKRQYLLASHIRCVCGGALVGETKKRGDHVNVYYRCPKHRYNHLEVGGCTEGYVRADAVEPAVWDWLLRLFTSPDDFNAGLQRMIERAQRDAGPIKNQLAACETNLRAAVADIKRLVAAFGDARDPVVAEALKAQVDEKTALKDSLERERAGLVARLATIEITPAQVAEIRALALEIGRNLAGATYEQKRQLMERLQLEVRLIRKEDGRRALEAECRLTAGPVLIELHDGGFKSRRPD